MLTKHHVFLAAAALASLVRGGFAAFMTAWLVAAPAQASGPHPLAYAQQLVKAGDHGARPFAVVDKSAAQLLVFHPDGTLAGTSPALLGRDPGDQSAAGVGERAQTGRLQPGDATTPAGRYFSAPGRNLQGEHIVWLDYGAALAIHRLRPGPTMLDRKRRLATPIASDNRVSAGCVVVPAEFYADVVYPLLGKTRGVVYILPDHLGLERDL